MSRESQLLNLMVEWEERRAAGQEASPEQLCHDCPELLEELKSRLQALGGMNAFLAAEGLPPDRRIAPTAAFVHPASPPAPALNAAWPTTPQYTVLEEIGRGGMGVVLKARQAALGRTVAIKAILPHGPIQEEQLRRFLREAQAMAHVQHPNIVQIYEISQQGEYPFIVMEYVEGKDLAKHLDGKPLPPRKAAELAAVLARAVHAAHAQGIIHRDLKPGNILLTADGAPKICDFGLARSLDASNDLTKAHQIAGTPSYMAPEQLVSAATPLGPAVDVYALGAVLYETLTGRPPFMADNPLHTMQLILRQEPVPPRQWQLTTPRDLETICLKCLAKAPQRRYATALELAEDLERHLAGEPIRARPVGPLQRVWRWRRRHPVGAALAAAAALAAVVVLSVILIYNRRLSQELDRTAAAHQQVLTTQEKLQRTVTLEVADRLDGDLRELEAVPRTMAAFLENRRDWDEASLERVLRAALPKTPLIFGLCVAFEPFAWRDDRRDFALYVYRGREGLAVKQLLPPSYQPHYREWEWYRAAIDGARGRWCEPYIGEGGDRTPMVTFSAPIHRDGRFIGVVAADLAMVFFRDLRKSLDRMDLGPNNYCFLITPGQRVLSHPVDAYEFPRPDAELTKIPLDAAVRALLGPSSRAATGVIHAVDPLSGQRAAFRFGRIPSSGWTLVTVLQ